MLLGQNKAMGMLQREQQAVNYLETRGVVLVRGLVQMYHTFSSPGDLKENHEIQELIVENNDI